MNARDPLADPLAPAAAAPRRVLVVHSSAELYGSDRSLLDFVRLCPPGLAHCVVLPEPGPLAQRLREAGAEVRIGEVCKVERAMLSPRGLARVAASALRAVGFARALHRERRFDLVYSNSVAVFGGALAARALGLPHVWHVREILAGHGALTAGYRAAVSALSTAVVANSGETQGWIAGPRRAADRRYRTVWNGYDLPEVPCGRDAVRAALGAGPDELLFVLVGRLNAWKGQRLAIEAFAAALRSAPVPLRLALVGSAYAGQERHEAEVRAAIAASGCAERIVLQPFRADVEAVWDAADVALVPSTRPEPFGRVAVEAMAFGKPVVASAHGGLVEIVVDGQTGRLFPPGDRDALAAALAELAADPSLRQRLGEAGRRRQLELFSVAGYARRLADLLQAAAGGEPDR